MEDPNLRHSPDPPEASLSPPFWTKCVGGGKLQNSPVSRKKSSGAQDLSGLRRHRHCDSPGRKNQLAQNPGVQRTAYCRRRQPRPPPLPQPAKSSVISTFNKGGWGVEGRPLTPKMSANLHQKMVKSVNIFPLSVGAGRPKVFSFSTSLITVSCNTCGKDTLSPCRQRQQAEVDTLPDPPVWGQARSRS